MPKVEVAGKEISYISNLISKYSRKRLYKIFNDEVDKGNFEPIDKMELRRDNFSLLIDKGKVLFRPREGERNIPVIFGIEDLTAGEKGEIGFKASGLKSARGAFKERRGKFILLRGGWKGFAVDIVIEPKSGYLLINGRIRHASERALRVGVELEFEAISWNWYEGLRTACKIEEARHYHLFSHNYTLGKNGRLPAYSFAALSNDSTGIMLGVNPQEPRIFEICYDAKEKRYCLFFDMAVTPKTKKFPNEVTFSAFVTLLSGEDTGLRGAVKKYYQLFPKAAEKRVRREGIWMPFSDIAAISGAEDFHFAYHELNVHYEGGLRSKADIDYNVSRGIYNFAYTEPWLCWLHMPKDMERNYDNALKLMEKNLSSEDEKIRDFASACFTSSIKKDDGKYFVRFADTPWCCGGVYNTNTDPNIATNDRAPINRACAELKQISRSLKDRRFHGAYLDSMQATEVGDDYDERHFAVAEFPLTFDKETRRPAISQFITAYHFTELLADYLRDEGKLLMGNFPAAFAFFIQHLDVPGEETGWLQDGKYKPMDDEELSVRRALSFKKPYLFLQAVDFDIFDKGMAERYIKRSLFYGMFPSMFSFNAQDAPYWENPAWYNRDRDLFKKYLPHIENLSRAGWEPVAKAGVDNDKIFLEQFGQPGDKEVYITCCNQTETPQKGRLDLSRFLVERKTLTLEEPLKDDAHSVTFDNPYIKLELNADDVILLKVKSSA